MLHTSLYYLTLCLRFTIRLDLQLCSLSTSLIYLYLHSRSLLVTSPIGLSLNIWFVFQLPTLTSNWETNKLINNHHSLILLSCISVISTRKCASEIKSVRTAVYTENLIVLEKKKFAKYSVCHKFYLLSSQFNAFINSPPEFLFINSIWRDTRTKSTQWNCQQKSSEDR